MKIHDLWWIREPFLWQHSNYFKNFKDSLKNDPFDKSSTSEYLNTTVWNVSKYVVFSCPYFPTFGLNTGKYGPEKTPFLDTFHAVYIYSNVVKKTFCFKAVFVSNVITNINGYISKYIWIGDWLLKLFLILILFYLALCFFFNILICIPYWFKVAHVANLKLVFTD